MDLVQIWYDEIGSDPAVYEWIRFKFGMMKDTIELKNTIELYSLVLV